MSLRVRRALEVLLVAMVVVPFGAGGILLVLPGEISKTTLGDSVATAVSNESRGDGYDAACSKGSKRSWRCDLTSADQSDTGVIYTLTTAGNCWTGTLVHAAGMVGLPKTPHSCIQLADELLG